MNVYVSRYSLLICISMVILASFSSLAYAQDTIEYPIVFDHSQLEQLRQLGISSGWGEMKAFHNKCYYYGDGGYRISVSDEFIERYRKQGFSLQSLCLGLVSGIRFDPETGGRLPTYIITELKALQDHEYKEVMTEAGSVTEELPFILPRCFYRGLPLSDCDMRFDLLTGKKLSNSTRQLRREYGALVEQFIALKMKDGWWATQYTSSEIKEGEHSKYRRKVGGVELDTESSVSQNLAPVLRMGEHPFGPIIGFIDVSPVFPKGFGYALYADGAAGPSVDSATVKAARDGKRRATEANITAIKSLLKNK